MKKIAAIKPKSSLAKIIKVVKPILQKNEVIKAGIFGSYARGEQKKSSDLDLLIQFKKGKGMFDLIRLERDLKVTLNKKIDLITYASINHLLKKSILDEEVRIM